MANQESHSSQQLASSLMVEVLSPSKTVMKASVGGISIPGKLGYLGILPGHAPFISELGKGELKLWGGELRLPTEFTIDGGYIEIFGTNAKILVDSIESKGSDAAAKSPAKH